MCIQNKTDKLLFKQNCWRNNESTTRVGGNIFRKTWYRKTMWNLVFLFCCHRSSCSDIYPYKGWIDPR